MEMAMSLTYMQGTVKGPIHYAEEYMKMMTSQWKQSDYNWRSICFELMP